MKTIEKDFPKIKEKLINQISTCQKQLHDLHIPETSRKQKHILLEKILKCFGRFERFLEGKFYSDEPKSLKNEGMMIISKKIENSLNVEYQEPSSEEIDINLQNTRS